MMNITDQDILLRLNSFEDAFVERKTASDSKDWLKTAVGFANSTPIGYPAILFIGVRNDGSIEGNNNLDSLQQTLNDKLEAAYPAIYYLPRVLERDGKKFLAVLIPGSEERPHFAGPSYVRAGSETKKANESQYDELIAQRQSKAREILRWKDQDITIERTFDGRTGKYPYVAKVAGCNAFYVTLIQGQDPNSFSLTRVNISYDDKGRRLKLEIHEHAV
jgi:predicted HTH transcriptional regulator